MPTRKSSTAGLPSNYSAELGSASGASVNIVTKSGSNIAHGGLYGFFRDSALDARDPFAFTPALLLGQFSLTATVSPHTMVGLRAPYNLANVNNWGQWDLYGVYVNPP